MKTFFSLLLAFCLPCIVQAADSFFFHNASPDSIYVYQKWALPDYTETLHGPISPGQTFEMTYNKILSIGLYASPGDVPSSPILVYYPVGLGDSPVFPNSPAIEDAGFVYESPSVYEYFEPGTWDGPPVTVYTNLDFAVHGLSWGATLGLSLVLWGYYAKVFKRMSDANPSL